MSNTPKISHAKKWTYFECSSLLHDYTKSSNVITDKCFIFGHQKDQFTDQRSTNTHTGGNKQEQLSTNLYVHEQNPFWQKWMNFCQHPVFSPELTRLSRQISLALFYLVMSSLYLFQCLWLILVYESLPEKLLLTISFPFSKKVIAHLKS